MFMAEPMRASNSFVGTEEYIAPVCYYSTFLYYWVPKTMVQYMPYSYTSFCIIECTLLL